MRRLPTTCATVAALLAAAFWLAGNGQAEEIPASAAPVTDSDRQHWAFRPLSRPNVPQAPESTSSSAVDAYLLEKLAWRGVGFSPAADRVTLIRRASLDLLGLPPSPEEVDAFLADASPDAYERLIDRLLASPHFGERWGRHWLDVAGYVDTVGFDVDANLIITSEGKWLYRDYVIAAFNQDKPFDRFIVEQLAGDELTDWRRAEKFTPEIRELLVATGYLRTARDLTHEDVGVIPQNFFGIVDDTLEIVGTGLLGLTLQCARCHTHKFDPIPQEDYYRLAALFRPAYNPLDWRPVISYDSKVRDRGVPDVSPAEQAEIERHNAAIDARVAALGGQLADLRRPHEDRLKQARLETLPEAIRADTQAALATPAEKRSEVQKYLAEKLGGILAVKPEELAAAMSEDERTSAGKLEAEIATANAGRRKWGKLQALVDLGPPPPTHLFLRGDYLTPGEEVPPGFLRVLSRGEADASPAIQPAHEGTSGRRLALARWLTDRQSPAAALMARVYVNRAWAKLFGRGIVGSLDNFGLQAAEPTHPELLEWLAADFVDRGWSVKTLLRTMLLSNAYRQASHRDAVVGQPDPAESDPANALLWRMPLKRLESEIVRDAVLAVCGQLNPAAGGPPILTDAKPDGAVLVNRQKLAHPTDEFRRSVYLLSRRAYNLSLLNVFDQPQVATNCVDRVASAVPLQSLTLLNDEFFHEQGARLAARVNAAGSLSLSEQIELAFRLVLVRRPDSEEAAWCQSHLAEQTELFRAAGATEAAASDQAWTQLCHTLLNTSEFLYAE